MKLGYGSFLFLLARCYKLGTSIKKSLEKAIYYCKIASENGVIPAYYEAARCYRKIGGEENKKKADIYFKFGDKAMKNSAETKIKKLKD